MRSGASARSRRRPVPAAAAGPARPRARCHSPGPPVAPAGPCVRWATSTSRRRSGWHGCAQDTAGRPHRHAPLHGRPRLHGAASSRLLALAPAHCAAAQPSAAWLPASSHPAGEGPKAEMSAPNVPPGCCCGSWGAPPSHMYKTLCPTPSLGAPPRPSGCVLLQYGASAACWQLRGVSPTELAVPHSTHTHCRSGAPPLAVTAPALPSTLGCGQSYLPPAATAAATVAPLPLPPRCTTCMRDSSSAAAAAAVAAAAAAAAASAASEPPPAMRCARLTTWQGTGTALRRVRSPHGLRCSAAPHAAPACSWRVGPPAAMANGAHNCRHQFLARPRTWRSTSTCLCSDQGWSQLQTQGESKRAQPSPLHLAQAWLAASCSTALCLQRQRSVHAPSATMKKNARHAHRAAQHARPAPPWSFRRWPHRLRREARRRREGVLDTGASNGLAVAGGPKQAAAHQRLSARIGQHSRPQEHTHASSVRVVASCVGAWLACGDRAGGHTPPLPGAADMPAIAMAACMPATPTLEGCFTCRHLRRGGVGTTDWTQTR